MQIKIRSGSNQIIHWASSILSVDPALLLHAFGLLAATVLGQILSFAVQILVARWIGVDAYGMYAYALIWINILVMLAVFGNERLIIRYGSEYRSQEEHGKFRALIRWASLWSGGAAVCLAAVFAAVCFTLIEPGALRFWIIFWGVLAILSQVASQLVESILRVQEAHGWASHPNRLFRPMMMGLIFILLISAGLVTADARSALSANALALLMLLLIVFLVLRQRMPASMPLNEARPLRAWRATTTSFGINALALHGTMIADMMILGFFHDYQTVGVYGAVIRIAGVMHFASIAVITIVQPMIVRVAQEGVHAKTQELVAGAAKLIFFVDFGLALLILLFAEPLLAVFGPGFESGALALRILAICSMVGSVVSVSGALLAMTGHEKRATAVMIAGGVLTVLLNFALIPPFGIIGAAIATGGARIIWNIALFSVAWKRLDIVAAPLVPAFVRTGKS